MHLNSQKTKSGLFIPEKAQGKVNEATVVAVGSGARDKVCYVFNKQDAQKNYL